MDMGEIEVLFGANGGVKYIPMISDEKKKRMQKQRK